ncbi:hypothetical protein [Nocardia carnea]|uniref:hypothetical protein n=1 Tax=Nocardia carnea TaxID=37328 RepID=UPI002454F923|nr:hypothetical protein [Nocardia carnea]
MKIWTERPAETDVEAVVGRYFGLLRAGKIAEAEQLVDHVPVRHVLESLWKGSVGAGPDDEADCRLAAGEWEQDLSWLGELVLGDFYWGHTGTHFYVEVIYQEQIIEVSLGFWVKLTDSGWVVAGPSTLW